jgi:RNA polymerase sigma-70 factor (ECF subfamily)
MWKTNGGAPPYRSCVALAADGRFELRLGVRGGLGPILRYNPRLITVPTLQNLDADLACIERVRARDAAALGELYDRHHRLVFAVILRMLKERAEAEEVLQEVFVQAWTRAATYDRCLGSPAGWLLGIARNRAIDRMRANAVRGRGLDAEPTTEPQADPAQTPERSAAAAERRRVVQRALDALPADQRELIEQAYFMGFTHSELAARFGLPLGTVKTRIRTGMLSLRRLLEATVTQS